GRLLDVVLADVAVDEGLDLGFGDADEHDGFVVLDQLGADDLAVQRQADDDVDRFAGIAPGVDDVGGQVDVADHPVARVGAGDCGLAFGGADAVGTGEDVAGPEVLQECAQPGACADGGAALAELEGLLRAAPLGRGSGPGRRGDQTGPQQEQGGDPEQAEGS